MTESVWYKNIGALFARPARFFPVPYDSPEERTNALVRLAAYVSMILTLYTGRAKYLYAGIAAIAAISAMHAHNPMFANGSMWPVLTSGAAQRIDAPGIGSASGGGISAVPVGSSREALDLAAGRGGPVSAAGCTRSTPENPFGNLLLTDIADRPDRPPACSYDEMKDESTKNFERGLFMNSTDVFSKENSQRQFYTMPVTTTIPDTYAFAQFLYGGSKNCKTTPKECTGWD
jgi:hypothetical protein